MTVEVPKSGSSVVRAGKLPIALGNSRASASVRARMLDREAARRAGADGPLFSLEAAGTTRSTTSVRARLDYSAFAAAFGGGYADRLKLVELPACAVSTPEKAECRSAEPVDTVNDTEKQTLTARSVTLAPSRATVLAAVADDASMGGDYKATPLSPSAQWSTSLNTGDFSWSYAMNVPEVPGGLAPSVGLSYSSGSIDGRTGNSNNQASWVGDGFDLWPGSIERRYKSCADDGVERPDGAKPADLCWAYDNAFISFNGKGGELVPTGADTFRLRDDDGTKVQRLRGTSTDVRANGARDDEYWKVTTPDGVQYYFGYNRLPGWASGKETTDSTWTAPVFGDDANEPCHASAFADSWCQQGWRWNLDYVVDPHGNAIAYYYDKESNSYGRNLDEKANTRYVRGGSLDRIEYGLRSTSMYSAQALAKVDFTNGKRCLPAGGSTCAEVETDAFHWYDTPWDLNCNAGATCDQGRLAPVFFTTKRLATVATQVLRNGTYADRLVDAGPPVGAGRHGLPASAAVHPAHRQERQSGHHPAEDHSRVHPARQPPRPDRRRLRPLHQGTPCLRRRRGRRTDRRQLLGARVQCLGAAHPADQHHPLLSPVHRRQRQRRPGTALVQQVRHLHRHADRPHGRRSRPGHDVRLPR
ncbi:hypothetical protein [Streptomyces sp. NPDC005805]|uniref:hypothetical protein n=1 Tax=Streptomyces sp. NPDC005805 TaxID=3157068 RepID=UPI0033E48A5D